MTAASGLVLLAGVTGRGLAAELLPYWLWLAVVVGIIAWLARSVAVFRAFQVVLTL